MTTLEKMLIALDPDRTQYRLDGLSVFVPTDAARGIEAAIRQEEQDKSAAEIERLRVRGDNALNVLDARYRAYEELEGEHVTLKAKADALRDAAKNLTDGLWRDFKGHTLVEDEVLDPFGNALAAYDAAAPTPEPELELEDVVDRLVWAARNWYHDHKSRPQLRRYADLYDAVEAYNTAHPDNSPEAQESARIRAAGQVNDAMPKNEIWVTDEEGRDVKRVMFATPDAPTDAEPINEFAESETPEQWLDRVTPKPGTLRDHEGRLFSIEKHVGLRPGEDHGPKWASWHPPVINEFAVQRRLDDHDRRLGFLFSLIQRNERESLERDQKLEAAPARPVVTVTDAMVDAFWDGSTKNATDATIAAYQDQFGSDRKPYQFQLGMIRRGLEAALAASEEGAK